MVQLRDLHAFEMLAAELHFGRAAVRLGVSQPTLSRYVRRLEKELGVVLAHRTSRTVRLTDAGHELANALPAALRQLERTLAATRAVAEGGWEI
jgi:DNA-binding transcriptional LysR family regulator